MAHLQKETNFSCLKEKTRLNPSSSPVSWLHKLAGFVGVGYLHFVSKTSFVYEWDHPEMLEFQREKKSFIHAFWHNTQVYLAYVHRGGYPNIIVSRSKDGEYIAQVMKRLRINAIRGSSSKGGEQALRDMVELLREGKVVGFTPDGPRGPLQTVHGGVVMAAQMSGAPIIPLSFCSTRCIYFKSWDKFRLPLPFASMVVAHGKPLYLDKDIPLETAKEMVRKALNDITDQAETRLKSLPLWGESLLGALIALLYSVLASLFIPITFLLLMLRYGRQRSFRFFNERLKPSLPIMGERKRLWLHAASIGEWQALRPVLARLKENPRIQFVITVSTPEARVLVAKEVPEAIVHMLPLDLPWVMNSWVKKLSPTAVGVVETELWPHMLRVLRKRRIPVFLINGRLSKRSSGRWRLVEPFIQRILDIFSVLFVRTEADGRHFVQLGAAVPRVHITGNTKVDSLVVSPPNNENLSEKNKNRTRLFGNSEGLYLVAGSTWSGEEAAFLKLFTDKNPTRLRLILAPRRLERVNEVSRLFQGLTVSWSLWSKVKESHQWDTDILLVDTLGDLNSLFKIADIGFVGGSLNPHGGQNPLEPAAAGIPVLFGPSMENFHEEAAGLVRAGAARQSRHETDMRSDVHELLENDSLRYNLGLAGVRYVQSKQGASDETAKAINRLFEL